MTRPASLFLLAAMLLPVTLTGCASHGYRKAEHAASELDSLRGNLSWIGEDLASVQESLQRVLAPAGAGTVLAFQDFQRQLQDVRTRFSAAEGDLQDVKSRGQSYFESWQEEAANIQDEEIRNDAIRRRETLLRAQDELVRATEAVRPQYLALMGSLEDLRIYFSNDLSAAGIESVRGPAGRIDQEIAALRARLEEVALLIERTKPGFTPAVLAASTTPGPDETSRP